MPFWQFDKCHQPHNFRREKSKNVYIFQKQLVLVATTNVLYYSLHIDWPFIVISLFYTED